MLGLVESYLTEQFKNLHTKCTITVTETPGSASPWLGNVDGASYQAAKKAIEVRIHRRTFLVPENLSLSLSSQAVYNRSPDFTREGGTIDVALTFSKMDGVKDVVLLPMGRSDDGAQYVSSFLLRPSHRLDVVTQLRQ
jgi:Cys-Gly metallodipeptidase DUG1